MTKTLFTLPLVVLCSVAAPRSAHADLALLPSFSTGASLFMEERATAAPHFMVGFGLDCLHDSGAALLSRIEATEELDASASLSFGWFGSGLIEGHGLALGVAFGPEIVRAREGQTSLGGRGDLVFSLWYDRVTITVGAGLSEPIGESEEGTLIKGQTLLRIAPWEPLPL